MSLILYGLMSIKMAGQFELQLTAGTYGFLSKVESFFSISAEFKTLLGESA